MYSLTAADFQCIISIMNLDEKMLAILNESDEDKLLSGIIDVFYQYQVDDFLILFTPGDDNFYISSKSKDGKLAINSSELQWQRNAIEENENLWYIESLLYDLKIGEETVLRAGKDYYVYTNNNDNVFLFVHYRQKEFSKSRHSEMIDFAHYLESVFAKIYLSKKSKVNQSLQRRLELINKKTGTLQRLATLLQSTFRLSRVLDIISRYISESLGFKVVLLSLYDEEENVFIRSAQYGLEDDVFESLKKQKVPFSRVDNLMTEENRISNSYYINHEKRDRFSEIDDLTYMLPDENPKDYAHWHPQDILFIPLYSKDNRILGMISVDKPENKNILIKEAIDILESFAQTAALAIENSTLFNKMDELINNLERVSNLSSKLTSYLELDALLEFLVKEIRTEFDYFNVSIWLLNREGRLEPRAFSGYESDYLDEYTYAITTGEGITGWVAENGMPVLSKDTNQDPRYLGRRDITLSEIAVPLKISNHIIGVLNVEREGKGALDNNDLRIISIIGSHLSTAIDNTFKYEETEKLAVTDGMTGMYNYRYFMNRLKEEMERSKRLDIPLSLIMIDIDFFKDINDNYGHIVGDKIIKELADLLRSIVRKGDIVTRYGGDEFFIILPGSSKKFTLKLAERIQKHVNDYEFTQNINITVSLGMVSYPADASTLDSLLRWVDNALYSAKKKGRNRVEGS